MDDEYGYPLNPQCIFCNQEKGTQAQPCCDYFAVMESLDVVDFIKFTETTQLDWDTVKELSGLAEEDKDIPF